MAIAHICSISHFPRAGTEKGAVAMAIARFLIFNNLAWRRGASQKRSGCTCTRSFSESLPARWKAL